MIRGALILAVVANTGGGGTDTGGGSETGGGSTSGDACSCDMRVLRQTLKLAGPVHVTVK